MIWAAIILGTILATLGVFEWRSWKSPSGQGVLPWNIPMSRNGPIKHTDLEKPRD
jgi:hypothetical protein